MVNPVTKLKDGNKISIYVDLDWVDREQGCLEVDELDNHTSRPVFYWDDVERRTVRKGWFQLGVPVKSVDTRYFEREIGAYNFDLASAFQTEIQMYNKGNPGAAKWYLDTLKEGGLFAMTSEFVRKTVHLGEVFEKDPVEELRKTGMVREVSGWCFPYIGALEKTKLEEDMKSIEFLVKRGDKELDRFGYSWSK